MKWHAQANALHRCALTLLITVFSACGGGGGGGDARPGDVGVPAVAEAECGSDSYPCSLDKVAPAVLERGESLADEVVAMLARGDAMTDVLAFVQAQPDVADAASGPAALRFRLGGGRDVFILRAVPVAAPVSAPASPAPASERKTAQRVVGGDNPALKRALVLSPFKYAFAPDDDGAAVAQLLEATRGYGGNVVYLENAAKTSATVGIQQFVGWQAFDVIHVTSHGARVCDQSRCISAILSGDIYSTAGDLLKLTEAGVNTARIVGSDERLLALGPTFFKNHYPAGLDRKIIFFNACQTYGSLGDGLSDVLLGQHSVFLGWTDVVENPAAKAAALAVFQALSATGVTVASALDSIGGLAINRYKSDADEITAILLHDRDVAGDLRLREVVTLERPKGGGELPANAIVPVIGIAQDGMVDSVPYQILIEGIPPEQQDQAIVTFTVDGRSSTPQAVTIGERVGDTGWRLTGSIPYIDVAPEQEVEMIARVQLPEGGTSEHRVAVRLAGEVPPDAETWIGESVSHFDDATPQGQVHITLAATVVFQQSPATLGGRFKVLRSVGGSIRWSRSGTIKTQFDGECTYSSGVIEMPIPEGDGEIIIDTAATPSTYSMSGFTPGETVRIAQACGDYAFSTRAGGAWGPAIGADEGFAASADGATIAGNYGMNLTAWSWTFRRQ